LHDEIKFYYFIYSVGSQNNDFWRARTISEYLTKTSGITHEKDWVRLYKNVRIHELHRKVNHTYLFSTDTKMMTRLSLVVARETIRKNIELPKESVLIDRLRQFLENNPKYCASIERGAMTPMLIQLLVLYVYKL
jgi:hypothetical protein